MRAFDLTVTGSLIVSGSTTLTGDISYDDVTATGNITTTGANKVISGSSTSTGSFGRVVVPAQPSGGPITLGGGSNKDLIVGDGSGTGDIVLHGNSESVLRFKYGAGATESYMIRALSTGVLTFRKDSASRVHLASDGKVAIGSNLAPTEMLHVGGNIFATGNISGSSTSTGSFGALGIGTSNIEADINFQPDVYTTGGQGIRWQDAVVTTDAIIQGVRQASNVGIGVFIGANSQVDTSGGISRFNTSDESSFISVDPRGDLYLGTGGTGANPSTRLYINSSGNIGIGTSSPDTNLHIESSTSDEPVVTIENTNNDATGGTLKFFKSTTDEANDDVIGTINFTGRNSANNVNQIANIITKVVDTTNGSVDGSMLFQVIGNGSFTNNLYLESGNVGIGTTSPTRKLHVEGDAIVTGILTAQEFHTEFVSASVLFDSGSTIFGDSSDDIHSMSGSLRVTGSGNHYIQTGNVGIGTTSPVTKLHLKDGSSTAVIAKFTNDTTGNTINDGSSIGIDADGDLLIYNTENKEIKFYTNDTQRAVIDNSGNVGIGITSPDGKLHVQEATAGSVTANTNFDTLVLENSAHAGMTIFSGTSSDGAIYFGDSGGNSRGQIKYLHGSDSMTFTTADGASSLTLDSGLNAEFGGNVSGSSTSTGSFETVHIANKVGIGTTTTTKELHIGDGTGTPHILMEGTNTGTNTAANGHIGAGIILRNIHDTDGNFNAIDGYNTNGLVDSRIAFIHDNHSSRHGEIGFLLHDGSSLTERIRFDKSGNVGIGTDSPTQKLHIHGGGMYLQTGQVITWNNGDATIGAVSGYHFAISTYTGTALTEKLRVTSTGNVGINTTSPSYILDVSGSSYEHGSALNLSAAAASKDSKHLKITRSSSTGSIGVAGSQANDPLWITRSDGYDLMITKEGNVGINESTPTAKLHIEAGSDNATGGIRLTNDDTGQASTDGTAIFIEQNTTDFFIRNYEDAGIRMRTNDTDALYISSGQKVGIGTTAPGSTLTVAGDISGSGNFHLKNNQALWMGSAAGAATYNGIFTDTDDKLIFRTNNTLAMAIDDANQNVGIGTDSPEALLHVKQGDSGLTVHPSSSIYTESTTAKDNAISILSGTSGKASLFLAAGNSGSPTYSSIAHSGNNLVLSNNNTEHFKIANNGDLTATDTTIGSISDERTKQNIQTYSGSLSVINTLRPVTFEWKSDEKKRGTLRGFIAQEITSSDAYWVRSGSVDVEQPDYEYLEGPSPSGSRSALISKLTEKDTMYVSAIQELTQAVRDLRAMITGSTDLNQLKAQVSSSSFV